MRWFYSLEVGKERVHPFHPTSINSPVFSFPRILSFRFRMGCYEGYMLGRSLQSRLPIARLNTTSRLPLPGQPRLTFHARRHHTSSVKPCANDRGLQHRMQRKCDPLLAANTPTLGAVAFDALSSCLHTLLGSNSFLPFFNVQAGHHLCSRDSHPA